MRKFWLALAIIISIFTSCTNYKKVLYFPDLKDSTRLAGITAPVTVIKKSDLLSISVNSISPEADKIFNNPNNSEVQANTQTNETLRPVGYLVGEDGHIRFPMLGLIKAEGLTKSQIAEHIRSALIERKLLIDPVVDIRHLNFKVTVIGEVVRPSVITVTNEKITLLEALGLVGDMTIFGKRENVLVIREGPDGRMAERINLNSNELLTSPYFYLRPDDVVYVEPSKTRVVRESRLYQLLPIIISGLSTSIFILDRIIR